MMIPIELVGLALVSSPFALVGYAVVFARRARTRNGADRCGHCDGPLYAARAFEGPSFVEGHLVCARCAARSRRRFKIALATAAVITALGAVAGVIFAVTAGPAMGLAAWSAPVIAICEYGLVFGGGVAWMKQRNRRAHLMLERQSRLSLPES